MVAVLLSFMSRDTLNQSPPPPPPVIFASFTLSLLPHSTFSIYSLNLELPFSSLRRIYEKTFLVLPLLSLHFVAVYHPPVALCPINSFPSVSFDPPPPSLSSLTCRAGLGVADFRRVRLPGLLAPSPKHPPHHPGQVCPGDVGCQRGGGRAAVANRHHTAQAQLNVYR